MKGASEYVLDSCNYYIDSNGEKKTLDLLKKEIILKQITRYAEDSLRTICFGYKDLKDHEGGAEHDDMDKDGVLREVEQEGFTLVAIVGIKDIVRPEVPEAVR